MKNVILKTCYIANILLVALIILLPVASFLEINSLLDFMTTNTGLSIRSVLSVLTAILWIYCIYLWAKFDKNMVRFVLILFLTAFYLIFYFKRALKEGWI